MYVTLFSPTQANLTLYLMDEPRAKKLTVCCERDKYTTYHMYRLVPVQTV